MREQVEVLEHHAHLLPVEVYIYLRVGYILVLEVYLALGGLFKEVQRAQERTLAAAGGSYDDHDLAAADLGADAVKRFDLAAVIVFLHVLDADYDVSAHSVSASFRVYPAAS